LEGDSVPRNSGLWEMIFSEIKLAGAYLVDLDRREDNRGHFARVFCADEFSEHGLKPTVAQASVSFNSKRGTLRGLHFQYPPAVETKYVRCTNGAVFDAIVDLRPESPNYLEHFSVVLSAKNGRGLYIPERFAHGFITLEDDTEVSYLTSESHKPNSEGGLRYDDPMLAVDWPLSAQVISQRDTAWRLISEMEDELGVRMSLGVAACN
jgi:dTDP-4-dehydrorhamnose 3,5-epimerase